MRNIPRRKFIQLSSASGAFLIVGCIPSAEGKEKLISKVTSNLPSIDLNQFISIGKDGSIILFNHRPEMGQGTYQSIPMILAEELEVDIDLVEIRQSQASRELYGSQMVVGSRSIQTQFEQLRIMGASAREILRQAAANKWETDLNDCRASNGRVVSNDGQVFTYGELIEDASKLEVPQKPPLKNPDQFKVIGKPFHRRDIPLKTNGEAQFGIDISVPGMLYASVERSPVFLGKIKSFDESEALKVQGVKQVISTSRTVYGRTRFGVAVLAESYWAAVQGRNVLLIEWDNQSLEEVSDLTIEKESLEASNSNGNELFGRGNTDKILDDSKEVIEASYQTPYQAHVPMEPMNAIVSVKENSAEFWGSTQNPNGIRSFIARKYEISENDIKINYTFMGGGFGRRSMTDVVEEAADLSKKSRVPVKVIWSREDDLTQGPFRACSLNVCRAVINDEGKVHALEHKIVAQEIRNQTGENMKAGRQLMGGINTNYTIPHLSVKGVLRKRHIPVSYWRAVYHSTNPFAHESFIDELAHRVKKDPIAFRLEMLDQPRYRRVLEEVAVRANWQASRTDNIGKGVAIAERSGAYFAMVVEVRKLKGRIVISRITTALDLGICINPDTVKAQTEGSIVMGLGAVYSGLTIKNGAVNEQNFNTYPMLKMDQCPEIETYIIKSNAPPDGAGESGLPTVAPALANAIFDLTGKRIRKLPIDMNGIM